MRKTLSNSRGEISTLVVVGMLMLVGVATLLTSTLNQNRQTTQTQAAATAACASGVTQGGSCGTNGQWCIQCKGERGPCASNAGVGVPYRCENGSWQIPSWGSECNVTCDISGGANNPPTPTAVPGSTCIYSQTGKCYYGVCFGQPCGYNLNCKWEPGYGQEVQCPNTPHGSNPTPVFVSGNPPAQPTQPQQQPAQPGNQTPPGASNPTNAPTSTPLPNTTDGRCTYIGDVDCITLTPQPNTTDGRCTYIGDVDCITLTPQPNTTDGRCTYIGDVDCITLTPQPNTTDGRCTYIGDVDCITLTPQPNTTDGRCTYIGDVDCITLTPKPTVRVYCDGNKSYECAQKNPKQVCVPDTNGGTCQNEPLDPWVNTYLSRTPTPSRYKITLGTPQSPTPTPVKIYLPVLGSGGITNSGAVTIDTERTSMLCLFRSINQECGSYLLTQDELDKLTR